MCGVLFHRAEKINKGSFTNALAEINSRGPDHQASFFGNGFAVGATRLAIIDLDSASNQPFWDRQRRYVLSYNGEIYNYAQIRAELETDRGVEFRTHSDTETLLEAILAYGLETTLSKVRGMFAFILYDTVSGDFWAVRDHFGQKPLYYCDGDGISIGSSIRSLLHLLPSVEPDFGSYATYLASRGIVHPEHTFFVGIRSVPAGHLLRFNGGALRLEEYFFAGSLFDAEQFETSGTRDEPEHLLELDGLFDTAVRRHLVSDVPVGILLSGGIDSTLLYDYAYNLSEMEGRSLTAFTKLSPGIEKVPQQVLPSLMSEKPTDWIINRERPQDYAYRLADLIRNYHAPVPWGGGPPMGRLCEKARALGIPVLIGGDCTDEYSGGYLCYQRMIRSFKGDFLELGDQVGVAEGSAPMHPETQSFLEFQTSYRRRLLDVLGPISDAIERFAASVLLHDTGVFLGSCNLPHSDAFSMQTSVELRNPMLDLDLVRYVVNLPLRFKLSWTEQGLNNKIILRSLARSRLGKWMDMPKEGTRNYSKYITDPSFWNFGDFALSESFPLRADMSWNVVFRLICLEIFHRIYFLDDGDPLERLLSPAGRDMIMGRRRN